MPAAIPFGNQHFHFVPEQFAAQVTEQFLDLLVDQHNCATLVEHQHAGGGGFDRQAKLFPRTQVIAVVADQLGKAGNFLVAVAQGGESDFHPAAAAILALAPTLDVEMAELTGLRQVVLWFSRGHLLGEVEAGEFSADDFFAAVAEEILRTRVPRGDPSGVIQLHYRKVAHRVALLLKRPLLRVDHGACRRLDFMLASLGSPVQGREPLSRGMYLPERNSVLRPLNRGPAAVPGHMNVCKYLKVMINMPLIGIALP